MNAEKTKGEQENMDVKRLLCIVSAMNTGGAETFLMKLYRKLDKTKYQMDFCVNDLKKGFYDDEIRSMGGRVYVIPCKSESIRLFRDGLSGIIKQNHYQYVLRITSNAMGFYDLKIAKDSGAKRCIARSSNSSDGEGLKSKLAHGMGRILYEKSVDVKIAPSDLAAKYTFGNREYEKGHVKILHNAIDLEYFRFSEKSRDDIRKELHVPKDAFVVGHIGRFSKQKNHTFLLDIFAHIAKKRSDAVLVLVGEGELKEQIKGKVKNLGLESQVIFTGVRSDVPMLLSSFDIFLFPSLYEGMPNTVIEAQATGLPCVIADTITKEANITGLVHYVPLGESPKQWTKKVLDCVSQERLDTTASFLKEKYDINSVVEEFERIVFGKADKI